MSLDWTNGRLGGHPTPAGGHNWREVSRDQQSPPDITTCVHLASASDLHNIETLETYFVQKYFFLALTPHVLQWSHALSLSLWSSRLCTIYIYLCVFTPGNILPCLLRILDIRQDLDLVRTLASPPPH